MLREHALTVVNVREARRKFYSLIERASKTHEPIVIIGKHGNAVLLSEDDWKDMKETLHLLSVPGMRKSIREGLSEDICECSKELDW